MRIIVTGQMRTGTTLIANVLSAQPNMRVVADFLHIERLKNAAGVARLSDSLTPEQKEKVITRFVGSPGGDGVEAIIDATGAELQFDTDPARFESLIEFYLDMLRQTQTAPDEIPGHKTTCAEPVLEELLTAVTDLKCIYMIRDPRDVALSNAGMMGQPASIVVQNWIEGLRVVRRLQDDHELADRVLIVRYEDLVRAPKATLEKVAPFLGRGRIEIPGGITWHGTDFVSNSSFGDIKKLFDPSGIGRWKAMDARIGLVAEVVGAEEMRRVGYGTSRLMRMHGWLWRCVPSPGRRALLKYQPQIRASAGLDVEAPRPGSG